MISLLMAKHLSGFSAESILDVGPGYGPFALMAAGLVGAQRIMYLDCNPAVLEYQKAACACANIQAGTLELTLTPEDLKQIDGKYDLILCQEVLEHVPEAPYVLQHLSKRLNPGGRFVITVPTKRSERWIKWLNPNYMKDEPFGHVNEFDERGLRELLKSAGLRPLVFLPTQPHYFVGHSWFFATRIQLEGSTGRIVTNDFRKSVFSWLTRNSLRFFLATGPEMWGRLLPRNYFVVAAPEARNR